MRSTRALERAGHKDLDFLWLLEGHTPDHSTYAAFRNRHAEAIRALQRDFAEALVRTRTEPLLELILDGTRLRADSDRQGARTAQFIENVLKELERRYEEMTRADAPAAPQTGTLEGMAPPADEADAPADGSVAALERQIEKYQKALDAARERDRRARERQGKDAKPVRVPVTDSDAQITPNKDGGFAPNYTPVAAVEPQTGAVLYDDVLEGSDEAGAVSPAVEAARAVTGRTPEAVMADGNFATGPVLESLDQAGIEAYMPIRSASPEGNPAERPDPTQPVSEADKARLPRHADHFARSAFVYEPEADAYRCPAGHPLPPYRQGRTSEGTAYTTYRCEACPGCPWAPECIKGKAAHRTVTRDAYEPHREATAARMKSEAGKAAYQKRAPAIEGLFAYIKSCLGIRRFARRGLEKVRCDWTWICTAYNLKKLLNHRAASQGNTPQTGPRRGGKSAGAPSFCPPAALEGPPAPRRAWARPVAHVY